jgi:hypothetical protein
LTHYVLPVNSVPFRKVIVYFCPLQHERQCQTDDGQHENEEKRVEPGELVVSVQSQDDDDDDGGDEAAHAAAAHEIAHVALGVGSEKREKTACRVNLKCHLQVFDGLS